MPRGCAVILPTSASRRSRSGASSPYPSAQGRLAKGAAGSDSVVDVDAVIVSTKSMMDTNADVGIYR